MSNTNLPIEKRNRTVSQIMAWPRALFEMIQMLWIVAGVFSVIVVSVTTLVICLIFNQLSWPLVFFGVIFGYLMVVGSLGFYGRPLEFFGMMFRYSLAKAYQSYGLLDLSEKILEAQLSNIGDKNDGMSITKRELYDGLLNLQLVKQGKLTKCEQICQRSYLQMKEKGKTDPTYASSLPYHANTLAAIYQTRGKFKQAQEICDEVRAQLESELRADSPAYGTALLCLAQCALEQHKFGDAESLARRYVRHCQDAKEHYPSQLVDQQPDRAVALQTEIAFGHWLMCRLHRQQRRAEQGIKEIEQGLEILKDEKLQLRLSLLLGDLLIEEGMTYLAMNDHDAAESALTKALKYYENRTSYFGPARGEAMVAHAYSRFKLGKMLNVLEDMKRGLDLIEAELEPDSPTIGDALHSMSIVLVSREMFDEAEPKLRRVIEIRQHHYDANDLDLADSRLQLARLLARSNRSEAAVIEFEKALKSYAASNDEKRNEMVAAIQDEVNAIKKSVD